MQQSIPLNQLEQSPRNVRKHVGSGFADLVASIASQGLLQGLVVSKPETSGGPYLVEAGGRRLSALRALVGKGSIPGDYPVPCRVVEVAAASEAGLTENVVRQAMHPADEFDAFKLLVDEGKTSDEIAERFGCPPKHVEQRLRLAAVAPDILDDYRAGNATLEQMQVLTVTGDHAKQREAWKAGAKNHWMREPEELRDLLVNKEVSDKSTLGKFVGVEEYEKAGGLMRTDLFGEERFFTDQTLLKTLAEAKLQKSLDKALKEGWSWGEIHPQFDWQAEQKFGNAPFKWEGTKKTWSADVKATAGVVITVDYNGKTEIKRGLVRPGDRAAASKAAGGKEVVGGKSVKPSKKPGELTFAGTQRLQAEATAIVRSALANNPQKALALLVGELADAWIRRNSEDPYSGTHRWVHLTREHTGRIHGPTSQSIDESPYAEAHRGLGAKYKPLLGAKGTKPRAWALEQSSETLLELLAYLVGRETEDIDVYPNGKAKPAVLAESVGVDLSTAWKPTHEWLGGLPRTTIMAMVQEANGRKGKELAAPLAKLKGEGLAKAALPLLPAGWLPLALRAPKAKAKPDAKQRAAGDTDSASEG